MKAFIKNQAFNKDPNISQNKSALAKHQAENSLYKSGNVGTKIDNEARPIDVDFNKINIFSSFSPHIQRDLNDFKQAKNKDNQKGGKELLANAASESSTPLDLLVQNKLKQHLNHDFSKIQVHQGRDSFRAAENLGARAYTLGNKIHLGHEVSNLNQTDRLKLLSHEAIHTVQQGGISVNPYSGLAVSRPGDTAEIEAVRLADLVTSQNVTPPSSRSLNLRNNMRKNESIQTVASKVSPHIQRDLTGKHTVKDGTFDLNLKTESHAGAKNGMSGTIKFTASDKAPDSTNIRLLQIAKLVDTSTGKDYVWTSGEANRNKVMTTADKAQGTQGGFFVDLLHAKRTPRASKADPDVSPYYIDDYGTGGGNQDGSKAGKIINEASLWDYPGWGSNCKFSFETAAKGADTGYIYATLRWGFTISDAAKGKVDHQHATANRGQSSTFDAAVKNFNEFYKNKGASTAP